MATRIASGLVLGLALTTLPQYTQWSAPTALGWPVNTTGAEGAPFLTKDGLTLYYAGPGPDGSNDLLVSHRPTVDLPWGAPFGIPALNTPANETNPQLSPDEHWLYFTTNISGGLGGQDIWVSHRHDRKDNLGWEAPVNLGSSVNSSSNDIAPTLFEDPATGVITMYFASDRAGSLDIYAITMRSDRTFAPASPVAELNSSFADQGPAVRRDGLEIFIASNRPGTMGQTDLMVSTRATTGDAWSTPVFLGTPVNTPGFDQAPALSFDRHTLFYVSTGNLPGATGPCSGPAGPCVSDIYFTTRQKVKDPND